jgi:hypothetical protein
VAERWHGVLLRALRACRDSHPCAPVGHTAAVRDGGVTNGNNTGLVYADGGLAASDRGAAPYGRPTARMGLPGGPDSVLGRLLGGPWYAVFFDLG